MSIAAFKWAKSEVSRRNDPTASPNGFIGGPAVSVLLNIADHHNDEMGRAWPSQETLAQETGFSVKTIGRATRWLVQNGLVAVERWQTLEKGNRLSYRYLLPRFSRRKPNPAVVQVAKDPGLLACSFDECERVPGTGYFVFSGDLT